MNTPFWTRTLGACLLLGVAGCSNPAPRETRPAGLAAAPSPGAPWEKVGKAFARDLAVNFRSTPLLLLRPLQWDGASPLERNLRTRNLARALRKATGWTVRTGGSLPRGERAVLEVTPRVRREEGIPGGPEEEVVEFTVRLAGADPGTAPPWTAAYPLVEETCRGFT